MTSMFAHTNQHTVLVTATLKAISTHQLSASVWYKILLLDWKSYKSASAFLQDGNFKELNERFKALALQHSSTLAAHLMPGDI